MNAVNDIAFWTELLTQNVEDRYSNISKVEEHLPDIINATASLRSVDVAHYLKLVNLLVFYLWILGKWEIWENFLQNGLAAALEAGERQYAATFLQRLAIIYGYQGHYELAEHYAQRAILNYQKSDCVDYDGLCLAYKHIVFTFIRRHRFSDAYNLMLLTDPCRDHLIDQRNIQVLDTEYATIELYTGSVERATDQLFQILEIRKPIKTASLAKTHVLIGDALCMLSNFELAKAHYWQAWEIARQVQFPYRIVESGLRLSKLYWEHNSSIPEAICLEDLKSIILSMNLRPELRSLQDLTYAMRELEQ